MTSAPAARRRRLLELLEAAVDAGARPARIADVDRLVDEGRAGLFLKHDVHALDLRALQEFAATEADRGLVGSYFFMVPDHPLTARRYRWDEQAEAMRAVNALGHEVGLHVDPYFVVHWRERSLADVLAETLDRFRAADIEVTCGNIHGNSMFKGPDRDGYGTSFDLFEEVARQPDFPNLAALDEETACTIREQRVRLSDHGFARWADMPLYSRRHGFVVTNFLTDNRLGKHGTIEVFVQAEALGQYKLADHQPPGSRNPSAPRATVPVKPVSSEIPLGSRHHSFGAEALREDLAALARQPLLCLLHPEHYC